MRATQVTEKRTLFVSFREYVSYDKERRSIRGVRSRAIHLHSSSGNSCNTNRSDRLFVLTRVRSGSLADDTRSTHSVDDYLLGPARDMRESTFQIGCPCQIILFLNSSSLFRVPRATARLQRATQGLHTRWCMQHGHNKGPICFTNSPGTRDGSVSFRFFPIIGLTFN